MTTTTTVFVWDGLLETRQAVNDSHYAVYWHGVVVANDNAAQAKAVPEPPRNAFKEFVDSDLQFEVTGTAKPLDGNVSDNNKFKAFALNLTDGAGWDFGGKKNADEAHEIAVSSLQWKGSPDPRDSLVFAKGKGEHGIFLSVGWMRPGNRVTLARRYLAESDPRASWTTEHLKEEVIKHIFNKKKFSMVLPPWHCAAFDA